MIQDVQLRYLDRHEPQRIKITAPSGPSLGTAGCQQMAGLLRHNTKYHNHWNTSYYTVYIEAVWAT